MKNKLLIMAIVVGLVLCGVGASIANQTAAAKPAAAKITVPVAGKTYTIGELLQHIRLNAPTANFLLPAIGRTAMTTAAYESDATKMDASISVNAAGLANLVDITNPDIASQKVTLKSATTSHINLLRTQGRIVLIGSKSPNKLVSTDYTPYFKRVSLYFDCGGYPMFIVDPCPAKIVNSTKAVPVISVILQKWDVNTQFPPAAPVAPAAIPEVLVGRTN